MPPCDRFRLPQMWLLYSWFRDSPYVHVTYGTLVDSPRLTPTAHICVGSKASWDEILDDLPRHEALPPGP